MKEIQIKAFSNLGIDTTGGKVALLGKQKHFNLKMP